MVPTGRIPLGLTFAVSILFFSVSPPSMVSRADSDPRRPMRIAAPAGVFVVRRSRRSIAHHSTVTDFARLRGLSMSVPFSLAV